MQGEEPRKTPSGILIRTGSFFPFEIKEASCKDTSLSKKIALRGLLFAAVTGATMLSVPVPGFRLYFNFGEGIIYTAAILLGPAWGAAAGGIGASLADILLGYPLWAPFTLIIKGAEGFITGKLGKKSAVFGIISGATVMTAGYTTMAGILYGWAAAPVELITDLIQCSMGAGIALMLMPPLKKALFRTGRQEK